MPKTPAVPQVIMPEFDVALLDVANRALQTAQLFVIKNDADYEAAAQMMKSCRAGERMNESGRKQQVDPLNASVKLINSRWMPATEVWNKAANIYSRMMGEYHNLKLAEQRRLQLAEDERAAAERAKLQKRAQKADERGQVDKAVALEQQAEMTVAPIVRIDPPKITGQSVREVWQFHIEDPSLIPREYLVPDEKKIGQFARMQKGMAKMPGVRFYSETKVASGV